MNDNIDTLITTLSLQPHPEGGYYRETYRSEDRLSREALPPRYRGERNVSTAIYFLLPKPQYSAFHRLKSDEMWHFYGGTSLTIYSIDNSGRLRETLLGNDFSSGEVPQVLIPRGDWFAAEVTGPGSYSLAGCTVAPGFDFSDFEMGVREEMCRNYPSHAALLNRLCLK